MRTKIISFLNNKGGVGKSSTVQALAYILSNSYKRKVLIVDIDPQANTTITLGNTDFMDLLKQKTGIIKDQESLISIEDLVINNSIDIHEAIKHTSIHNVDIIQALPTLAAVEESLKADIRTPQQFRLRNQLAKLHDNEYDYVLIDCGPSLSILNINALVASDEVFIPTQVDSGSLWGVTMTINELIKPVRSYAPGLTLGGIFVTRCRDYTTAAREGYRILEELYPDKLLPITINENVAVQNSSQKRIPLPKLNKRAQATKDYYMLAGYIDAADRSTYLRKLMEEG